VVEGPSSKQEAARFDLQYCKKKRIGKEEEEEEKEKKKKKNHSFFFFFLPKIKLIKK
jgi:hypothetical protein